MLLRPNPSLGVPIYLQLMMERGNWSLDINEDVRKRNVDAAIQFFSAMRPARPGVPLTRWEPRETPPTADGFFDLES